MLTKESILKEIKKGAKENEGKPLSEKRLKENTDIGITDLRKHWSNYGEAVREAGLIPNPFDKTTYSHEQLCEIFIEVIREKGRWPTRGVLDVKHNNSSDFPDSSTFYKKLGTTNNLAQTILEYVEDRQGFGDVVNICNSVMEKYRNENETTDDGKIEGGFVYLGLQHGDYKIGFTIDLDRRRDDITLLGSAPMVWIHKIETDDMKGVERYWQNRFKSKWLRGEWYKLNSSDVKAFKRWKRIF